MNNSEITLRNIYKELQKIADTNIQDMQLKKLDIKVQQLENDVQKMEICREKQKLEQQRRDLEIETKKSYQKYKKLQQKYLEKHENFKQLIEKMIILHSRQRQQQHGDDDCDDDNDKNIEPFENLLRDAENLLQENDTYLETLIKTAKPC